jgi:hypothetical protein
MERRFAASDIRGLKFFKPVRELLNRLHGEAAHPNRELHFDEYICLLLLSYFNPLVSTLRDIQAVSDHDVIAKRFGVRRASLGSLSEASQVFDPDALRAIFQELSDQAQARWNVAGRLAAHAVGGLAGKAPARREDPSGVRYSAQRTDRRDVDGRKR